MGPSGSRAQARPDGGGARNPPEAGSGRGSHGSAGQLRLLKTRPSPHPRPHPPPQQPLLGPPFPSLSARWAPCTHGAKPITPTSGTKSGAGAKQGRPPAMTGGQNSHLVFRASAAAGPVFRPASALEKGGVFLADKSPGICRLALMDPGVAGRVGRCSSEATNEPVSRGPDGSQGLQVVTSTAHCGRGGSKGEEGGCPFLPPGLVVSHQAVEEGHCRSFPQASFLPPGPSGESPGSLSCTGSYGSTWRHPAWQAGLQGPSASLPGTPAGHICVHRLPTARPPGSPGLQRSSSSPAAVLSCWPSSYSSLRATSHTHATAFLGSHVPAAGGHWDTVPDAPISPPTAPRAHHARLWSPRHPALHPLPHVPT